MDELELYYSNKMKIEQIWSLLEVCEQLTNDILCYSEDGFSNVNDIYETIIKLSEELYKTYEDNRLEHLEK